MKKEEILTKTTNLSNFQNEELLPLRTSWLGGGCTFCNIFQTITREREFFSSHPLKYCPVGRYYLLLSLTFVQPSPNRYCLTDLYKEEVNSSPRRYFLDTYSVVIESQLFIIIFIPYPFMPTFVFTVNESRVEHYNTS